MGGRERKSIGKKSTGQSSCTTTTIGTDFGPQLQRNNVVFTSLDARVADDEEVVREFLHRTRESESPDRLDYKEYLVTTQGYKNEATIQHSAYPLLSKRTSREARISGYGQNANYAWSEVDNHLTTGLSDAKPDIFESYRKTDYPPEAVDALSSALAPTLYDLAMPAFAIEVKGHDGSMQVAQLQCAYDGTLMTEGARSIHTYIDKSDDDFYGKTQALTVGYNGENLNFYGHYALQIPALSDLGIYESAGSGVVSLEVAGGTAARLEYHQYLLSCNNPRASYEDFKKAYRHTRNAQDIGYKWATERKDALWANQNANNIQTSPNALVSSHQSQNDFLAPISTTPDVHNCNNDDNAMNPTGQLLREHSTRSAAKQQISTSSNEYASPDVPITPPRSSKEVKVSLEPPQLPASSVTEDKKEDVDSNEGNQRKTRRIRTLDIIERQTDIESTARKTRRKR